MVCHTSKDLGNLKDLLYLAGNLRRTFTTFIVGIASIRYSELRIAPNYKFLMENGPFVNPTNEDHGEQAKRACSSSSHRNAPSKQRRNNKSESEERDLRSKLESNDKARGRR